MKATTTPQQCCDYIHKNYSIQAPKVGLILGSGLGGIAARIQQATTISYADLPGFPQSAVDGHAGQLHCGILGNTPIACLQGRAHVYEGTSGHSIKQMIRTLKLLGCEKLIVTNAAGSLHSDVRPGSLMLINDHINFQIQNPLIGPNDDEFGPRFVDMSSAYDHTLRQTLRKTAEANNIKTSTGVYIGVTGPMFETPAEIHAFRTLGADAVGMSTVAEVIVARHCGLKVAAISAITNLAAGMSEEELTHEGTLTHGQIAAKDLQQLLVKFLENKPCLQISIN